jgi:hypothetical protein
LASKPPRLIASFGHQFKQAKQPAQLSDHTGLSSTISTLSIGQILSQIPQPLQSSLEVKASDPVPFNKTCFRNFSKDGTMLMILD